MAGILDQARRLFGRERRPDAVPFAFRCWCGQALEGQRTEESQRVTCPGCGNWVFVFPRSPLPALANGTTKKKVKSKSGAEAADGKAAAPKAPRRSLADLPKLLGQQLVTLAWKLVPPRSWFTVPRVGSALAVLVAVLSIWGKVHFGRLREFREQREPRAQRGLQALIEGRLDEAHDHLAFVMQASNALRDPTANDDRHRQAFGEVAAVHDLIDAPLDRWLADIDLQRVNRELVGKTLILDAKIEPAGEGRWRIQWLAFADDRPVLLDVSGLDLLNQLKPTEPTRLIFGARVGKVTESDEQRTIQFVADSGVLLTEPKIYERLGIVGADADLIRQRQRKDVGLDEPASKPR